MDEGIKPIVPLVILAIIAAVLFLAATGVGNMVVDGIQQVVMNLFQEVGVNVN